LRKKTEEERRLNDMNDLLRRKLEEAHAKISILEQEGTRKHCIEERNDWKALVAALNKDRSRISKENEEMKSKIAQLSNERDDALARIQNLSSELDTYKNSTVDDSKSSRTSSDTKSDLARRLVEENARLREINLRLTSGDDTAEDDIKEAIETHSKQMEDLFRLKKENEALRGKLLREQTLKSKGFFSDLSLRSAFQLCSKPPQQRHVVEM
jgi:chromosome segregation ATPase